MKCIIAAVMLLLAINANASVLPLAYSAPYGLPLSYAPQISLSQGIAGLYSYQGLPAPIALHAAPAPVALHAAPAPVALHAAVLPAASYVATTRGAQHVAPLPGHVESVSSQNLQPAPGTL